MAVFYTTRFRKIWPISHRGVILAVFQSYALFNFHGLDFGVVLPDIYNNH